MLTIIIAFALLSTIAAHDKRTPVHVSLIHKHKERTAESAIECGLKYADLDKDGGISVAEVTVIRRIALGALLDTGVSLLSHLPIVGKKITVEQIFRDCDYNKDGIITLEDFPHMRATCLETQGKIDDVFAWVCAPGAKGLFDNAKLE